MGIIKVQIVSVPVVDQDRSAAFYTDALGFKLIANEPMGPTMRWVQLAVPSTTFSITLVTWFDQMPPGTLRGLMYNVDDVDAMAADLHARGYLADATVKEEPWGRYVTIDDPDGNSLILQQDPS